MPIWMQTRMNPWALVGCIHSVKYLVGYFPSLIYGLAANPGDEYID
jgi:hypothetical protein